MALHQHNEARMAGQVRPVAAGRPQRRAGDPTPAPPGFPIPARWLSHGHGGRPARRAGSGGECGGGGVFGFGSARRALSVLRFSAGAVFGAPQPRLPAWPAHVRAGLLRGAAQDPRQRRRSGRGAPGERTIVIARELTKVFESIASLPLQGAPAWMRAEANRQRGEFVLIVSGAPEKETGRAPGGRALRIRSANCHSRRRCGSPAR